MTDDAQRIEGPTPGGSAIGRLKNNLRGGFKMLAPLGFYLLNILITCSTILLISWAYDTHRAQIEVGRTPLADSQFGLDPVPQEWESDVASMDDEGRRVQKRHAA
jgi:hypothetical protein